MLLTFSDWLRELCTAKNVSARYLAVPPSPFLSVHDVHIKEA